MGTFISFEKIIYGSLDEVWRKLSDRFGLKDSISSYMIIIPYFLLFVNKKVIKIEFIFTVANQHFRRRDNFRSFRLVC